MYLIFISNPHFIPHLFIKMSLLPLRNLHLFFILLWTPLNTKALSFLFLRFIHCLEIKFLRFGFCMLLKFHLKNFLSGWKYFLCLNFQSFVCQVILVWLKQIFGKRFSLNHQKLVIKQVFKFHLRLTKLYFLRYDFLEFRCHFWKILFLLLFLGFISHYL